MSLFDVLRYPISDKPTFEELSRLPKELFDKWVRKSRWKRTNYHKDVIGISGYYKHSLIEKWAIKEIEEDVAILRNVIKEYEVDNEPI